MSSTPVGRTQLGKALRSPWAWLLVALVTGALLSVANGLSNGWDLINYHLYNPWALFHHRQDIDLFAAGIQGYFDPLLDIPYYLVAYVWLPNEPYIVAALTGLPYGLLAFFALLLARSVLKELAGHNVVARTVTILAVVVMAVSGVSTWSQAFTTTNEVLVSTVVLGAVILLVQSFGRLSTRPLRWKRALGIGVLLGCAAGLKLTAVFYTPAGTLLVLAASPSWKSTVRNGAIFVAGWTAAFAMLYGPWAVHLYASTGNPFFPMFNHFFRSPLASVNDLSRDSRFLPGGAMEWLFAPFYWLNDNTYTVFPLQFRDVRFALAYVLGPIIVLTTLIARYQKDEGKRKAPRPLLALFAFWFISYAVWLPLFSMLRYAIVLEISSAILAAGAILYLTKLLLPRLGDILPMALMIVLAAGVMGFANIPSYDGVPLQTPVFGSHAPRLGPKPLVILAEQPMGLLAPLIQRANPEASFIGMGSCFTRNDWCYNGFYEYALGDRMRDMISRHKGVMYVAYYTDRVPALTQLDSFHVVIDRTENCQVMSTNRTADVRLCPAHYQPGPLVQPRSTLRFRLAAKTETLDPAFKLSSRWTQNVCTTTDNLGQIVFDWHAPDSVNQVKIFVESPNSTARTLFASGGAAGKAETGPWVKSAQTFVFVDAEDRVLAQSTISHTQCEAGR